MIDKYVEYFKSHIFSQRTKLKNLCLFVGLTGVFVVLILFGPKEVTAVCTPDILDDWSDAPCGLPLSAEKLREDWQGYYEFKGSDWMEEKRTEMEVAILSGTLEQWRSSASNHNVWLYYKITNNVPEVPPLKQFKSGVPVNEIKCKKEQHLITKSHNGYPACVSEQTKTKLISIGWMKTQVDIHNDSVFIESTKNLDEVHRFLTLHPNANIAVNHESYTVTYEESGFRKHPSSKIIYQTKRLIVNLDYEGKPVPSYAECSGGGVSLVGPVESLTNPNWCFPLDQSQFKSLNDTQNDNQINSEFCKSNNGKWFDQNQECVGIPKTTCEVNNGSFNACGSYCKYYSAAFCPDVCLSVCSAK